VRVAGLIALEGAVVTDSNLRESSQVEPVRRRRFTKAQKAVIVAEYAAAETATERGMVLRQYGTFQQNVSRWTRELQMTTSKATASKTSAAEAKLAKQLAVAEAKLAKANDEVELLTELVAAQGKVLGLHAKHAGSPPQG
jgi:transposase-like protein